MNQTQLNECFAATWQSAADEMTAIQDFVAPRLYDVATCLGSINFGNEARIAEHIACVVQCLTPESRRLNPGRYDHGNATCKDIEFFPWTFTKLRKYAALHGYTQTNEAVEDSEDILRLYAEWHR